jgi:beta-lactamase class A
MPLSFHLPAVIVPFAVLAFLATACFADSAPTAHTEDATPTITSTAIPRPHLTPRPRRTPTPSPTPTATPIGRPQRPDVTPIAQVCLQQDDATPTPTPRVAATRAPTPRRGETPEPEETPSLRVTPREGVVPGPGHEALPLRIDGELQQGIEELIGEEQSYAVYVKDMASGRGAVVNEDAVFYAASIFKLTVMYEVLNQVQQGLIALDEVLTLTPYYEAYGLGPRATALCQELTVFEALQAMMSISDNAAAVLLQDVVGAPNINASMESLGMTQTRLLTEDLPVTALDLALLLDAIVRSEAINPEASTLMVELLLSEEFDNGIASPLPPEAEVAHKTGNWVNATHDAAIVYGPGVTYLLVVLSDRDHETQLIQDISRLVYEHFVAP